MYILNIYTHTHIYTSVFVWVVTSKPLGSIHFAFAKGFVCLFFPGTRVPSWFKDVTLLTCCTWALRPSFSLHPGQVVTQEPGESMFCPSHPAEIPDGCRVGWSHSLLCNLFLKARGYWFKSQKASVKLLVSQGVPGMREWGFFVFSSNEVFHLSLELNPLSV